VSRDETQDAACVREHAREIAAAARAARERSAWILIQNGLRRRRAETLDVEEDTEAVLRSALCDPRPGR
jgi:hypothetical protein